MSKKKDRKFKKLEIMKDQLAIVLKAVMKLGVDIAHFFQMAAAKAAKKFRVQSEIAKFAKVQQDGHERHVGYKVPEPVLALAKAICQPVTPEAQPA